jgi:hypothetical protein
LHASSNDIVFNFLVQPPSCFFLFEHTAHTDNIGEVSYAHMARRSEHATIQLVTDAIDDWLATRGSWVGGWNDKLDAVDNALRALVEEHREQLTEQNKILGRIQRAVERLHARRSEEILETPQAESLEVLA